MWNLRCAGLGQDPAISTEPGFEGFVMQREKKNRSEFEAFLKAQRISELRQLVICIISTGLN